MVMCTVCKYSSSFFTICDGHNLQNMRNQNKNHEAALCCITPNVVNPKIFGGTVRSGTEDITLSPQIRSRVYENYGNTCYFSAVFQTLYWSLGLKTLNTLCVNLSKRYQEFYQIVNKSTVKMNIDDIVKEGVNKESLSYKNLFLYVKGCIDRYEKQESMEYYTKKLCRLFYTIGSPGEAQPVYELIMTQHLNYLKGILANYEVNVPNNIVDAITRAINNVPCNRIHKLYECQSWRKKRSRRTTSLSVCRHE